MRTSILTLAFPACLAALPAQALEVRISPLLSHKVLSHSGSQNLKQWAGSGLTKAVDPVLETLKGQSRSMSAPGLSLHAALVVSDQTEIDVGFSHVKHAPRRGETIESLTPSFAFIYKLGTEAAARFFIGIGLSRSRYSWKYKLVTQRRGLDQPGLASLGEQFAVGTDGTSRFDQFNVEVRLGYRWTLSQHFAIATEYLGSHSLQGTDLTITEYGAVSPLSQYGYVQTRELRDVSIQAHEFSIAVEAKI